MVDIIHEEPTPPSILARSKRQAMDWSLVLASQGIAALVNKSDNAWGLWIEPPDLERAKAALAQYQLENRGWRWRPHWSGGGLIFHWGSLLWVVAIAAIYYWSTVRFPGLKEAGMVDNQAIAKGEWWRLFTGVTLHENLPHLLSNASTGFLLLGLVMARFGPGIGTLAAFLAGVAGNCASVLIYPDPHASLGASGMVTGALGLLTVQAVTWRRGQFAVRHVLWRATAAGTLVLVLIGFSPGTDTAAHVGGFVAGFGAGMALAWIRPAALRRSTPNLACGIALAGLIWATWSLAARSP